MKMKKNNDYHYSGISSFEDFRVEKEHLKFKSKLSETKINLSVLKVRENFSFSSQLFSVAREAILRRISDLLESLLKKGDKETDA
jgi:hypothetical protein